MKRSKLLSLIFALLLNLQVQSSEPQIINSFWMAFQAGDTMLTNMDVEDYICATNMSDELMMALFKQAEGDYNRYQVLRRAWAQARFKDGLRQYAYIYAMQKMATNKFWNKEGRKAFTITEKDYFDKVQEMETKVLKKWLDERQGIVKARDAFGAELKKMGYPHKEGISNTDLYFEWYDLQKVRIKESMRIEELRKYEYISALGYRREFDVRPLETSDFQREVSAKIQNLNGTRISAGELAAEIEKDPRLSVLIKNAEFLGPDSVTLGKLKAEAPAVFAEYKAIIENEVYPELQNNIAAAISRYEGIAKKLADKYNDVEKLKELSDEMKKEFLLGTGDFNHFMMSKLYTMAAVMIEQGSSFKGTNAESQEAKDTYVTSLLKEAQNIAAEVLENPEAIGNMRLEDHFIQTINEAPVATEAKEVLSSDEYLKEFKSMAHWVVKFQFKKSALKVAPMVAIDEYDKSNYERYDRVKNYLIQKQFTQELDKFRRDTARRRAPYMRIQTGTGADGEVQDSWDFVLEKFPKVERRR